MESESLRTLHPHRWDVPALAIASLIALGFGVSTPIVTTDELLSSPSSYSALAGVKELLHAGHMPLALLILVFSILFPAAKLALLLVLWFIPMQRSRRSRLLTWLESLGKWSMLDVFVVVILAGLLQLGILAHTSPRFGVFIFGGAILLSMVATVDATLLVREESAHAAQAHKRIFHLPIVAATSLIVFLMALSNPLMKVEKWIFWSHDFSVLGATNELLAKGQTLLGVGFFLFVVALPLLQQVALVAVTILQAIGKSAPGLVRWGLQIDHWAMMDVFVLAAVVVANRIDELVSVTPQRGLELYALAAVLSVYTSIQIHRVYPRSVRPAPEAA